MIMSIKGVNIVKKITVNMGGKDCTTTIHNYYGRNKRLVTFIFSIAKQFVT